MSAEINGDPRTALMREKFFSMRPQALERWIWNQNLSQAAERVFWLHWDLGARKGNWCSQVSVSFVARCCGINSATVTRAYKRLRALGLVLRQDTGRDAKNPFRRRIALTEVRLPKEFCSRLSSLPSRRRRESIPAVVDDSKAAAVPQNRVCRDLKAEREVVAKLSQQELAQMHEATRQRQPASMKFDAETRLTAAEREVVTAIIASHVQPTQASRVNSAIRGTSQEIRSAFRCLSDLDIARIRRESEKIVGAREGIRVANEITWAVLHGALRRFAPLHAINIALKKMREGAWKTPFGMPANAAPSGARMVA